MSGVTMYVEYLMPDGRQLHKRFVRLVCVIPPGETRMAELQSWDKQKSFYYEGSGPPGAVARPIRWCSILFPTIFVFDGRSRRRLFPLRGGLLDPDLERRRVAPLQQGHEVVVARLGIP